MKRHVRKIGRRISAEKVPDPHVPDGFLPNHHKITAAAGGTNPMLAHHSAPAAAHAPQKAPQRTKRVVRRSSDTAIREWDDIEAQRRALEALRQIGPVSSGGNGAADDGRGGNRKRAVRRSTVGDMDGSSASYPSIAEAVPPSGPGGSPATQGTPITVVSARRAPNMRRGSTEGVLHLERQRENRRGSFLFDLPHSGEALRSDSPPQAYDTLRSHDDVDADLDLARDTLPADAFTGSREVSELELQAAAQLAGSKSAPAAGAAGQQEMQMRSATEVRQAVSRARERLPSDEWSEEARRTTHQVLITFDAIAKPNDGFGDDGDDSSSLIVWRSPDEVSSGDIADSSGSSGGTALESYGLPQRLQPSHTAGPDDPTHPRQDSTAAPSVSPRRPGGINRSRQKTVWSAPMSSSGDEEHQQDWSDTDSDHDGEDGSGPAGEHGHHRLRSGSAGADDDGAHRIGGTGTDDGAQRIGGGSSNAGVGDSMRSLAPTGDQPVDGNGTSSTCLHSAASGDAMDSDGGLRGGGRTVVGDVPAVGNDGGMAQMLQMMSERCTKVQQEKHRLEERVTELEREKEEWETLKAQLISTLLNEGED